MRSLLFLNSSEVFYPSLGRTPLALFIRTLWSESVVSS